MDTRVIVLLAAEAAMALVLLYFSGVFKKPAHVAVSAVLIAAAMALRGCVLYWQTGDYNDFLAKWVRYFADNGGFSGLKGSIGNYNIPYLYFLAWFSSSDIRDLYLIKLLSIFFDVILAWASMQLAGLFTKSTGRKLFCFFAVLFLPTVFLNGALWGQCDSIYAAFAVLGVYLALSNRPWSSVVCAALSFAFKLQAVFVMPVYAAFLFSGRIKVRHVLAFPLTYLAAVLPAVLLGRPFLDTLTLYFSQAGSVGDGLNYNSPSIFSILTSTPDAAKWSKFAVLWAFAFVLTLLFVLYKKRRTADNRVLLAAAVLFAVAVPFLLPHMHDRYFFCADVLTLVLAVAFPETLVLPCLVEFGSFLSYYAYLGMRYLLPPATGGWAMAASFVLAAAYLAVCLGRSGRHGRMLDY